jgi:uncharacterized caspase-like protein
MRNIAIAIGINQYRNLQHLQYAKNDAQLFRDFLLRDAGFDRVWYFADDSPEIEGVSTEPIRSNLLTVLNDLSENAPSLEIDNLWFFSHESDLAISQAKQGEKCNFVFRCLS